MTMTLRIQIQDRFRLEQLDRIAIWANTIVLGGQIEDRFRLEHLKVEDSPQL